MTTLSLVPKPTASDEIRADVIEILEDALVQAKQGQITSLVVIMLHPDGSWSDWQSSTTQLSEVVGRLECAKQKRVMQVIS